MFPNLKASLAPLVLRLGLASIFLYHGYLKLAYQGGAGWSPDLSESVQLIICWSELIGGLALAFGVLTRVAAVGFTVIMLGAIVTVTGARDFVYMQFFARGVKGYLFQQVGYEYNFVIIVNCLALIVLGSGQWSVDHYLVSRFRRKKPARTTEMKDTKTSEPMLATGQVGAGTESASSR